MSLEAMPLAALHQVTSFLTVKDIVRLGRSCSKLYGALCIRAKRLIHSRACENLENSDLLYCQFTLDESLRNSSSTLSLRMLKFSFQTKDQGWVSSVQSCSWIQAEFEDVAGNSLVGGAQSNETISNRLPLVWNYQVSHYQNKAKFLNVQNLLLNTYKIRIYLRSRLPRNKISCKSAEVMLYFGSADLEINEKQLVEQIALRKRRPLRRL